MVVQWVLLCALLMLVLTSLYDALVYPTVCLCFVLCVCAFCCSRWCRFVQIFPCLQQLVMDSSDHVRQALASVMNDMSPVLGRESTINHLLPMLLTLLRDTNPEVREHALINHRLGVGRSGGREGVKAHP